MKTGRKLRLGNERGMVLVAAMMVMALLAMLGAAGIATSTLEVKIAAHDRDAKQSFYLCEAGLEKAKYEIIRGWGEGTVNTGTNDTFMFTSDPPNQTWWGDDKWVGFTLMDEMGASCTIGSNTQTSPFVATCTTGSTGITSGSARLYLDVTTARTVVYSGSGTAGGNIMIVSGNPLGVSSNDMFDGLFLNQSGTYHEITNVDFDGSYTTITVSGTLSSLGTTFTVERAGPASANDFRWYDNPTSSDPGAPSAAWQTSSFSFTTGAWYLVDSNQNSFQITGTDFPTVLSTEPQYMRFQLATSTQTPAPGPFKVVCNPWLSVNSASPVTYTQGGSGSTFQAPSGLTNYGTVSVTITPDATNPGRFTVTSTSNSSAVGNRKSIVIDAEVGSSGNISINNWRQVL